MLLVFKFIYKLETIYYKIIPFELLIYNFGMTNRQNVCGYVLISY